MLTCTEKNYSSHKQHHTEHSNHHPFQHCTFTERKEKKKKKLALQTFVKLEFHPLALFLGDVLQGLEIELD